MGHLEDQLRWSGGARAQSPAQSLLHTSIWVAVSSHKADTAHNQWSSKELRCTEFDSSGQERIAGCKDEKFCWFVFNCSSVCCLLKRSDSQRQITDRLKLPVFTTFTFTTAYIWELHNRANITVRSSVVCNLFEARTSLAFLKTSQSTGGYLSRNLTYLE